MATVGYEKATRVFPGTSRPAVDGLDLDIGDGELLGRPTRHEDDAAAVSLNQLLLDQPQLVVAGSAVVLGDVHVGAGAILKEA
jgi:hypothetical protein